MAFKILIRIHPITFLTLLTGPLRDSDCLWRYFIYLAEAFLSLSHSASPSHSCPWTLAAALSHMLTDKLLEGVQHPSQSHPAKTIHVQSRSIVLIFITFFFPSLNLLYFAPIFYVGASPVVELQQAVYIYIYTLTFLNVCFSSNKNWIR